MTWGGLVRAAELMLLAPSPSFNLNYPQWIAARIEARTMISMQCDEQRKTEAEDDHRYHKVKIGQDGPGFIDRDHPRPVDLLRSLPCTVLLEHSISECPYR